MAKGYKQVLRQQVALLSKLSRDTKRDYYVDLFIATFVATLKECRRERRMSMEETAEKVGVTVRTLSRIEGLEKGPTLRQLALYSYAVGAPPRWIAHVLEREDWKDEE